ncbi:Kelch-like protein 10 [Zootermopsis nevadensis]|uniref:Kelch-like protein 10 n=1 Tax=Zootermopsis nevadensis TaxID=136037 RepID=A0A067QSS6_ZOONE|nr:Kelch-like protein 10 [Zootermopsis nevadensis]
MAASDQRQVTSESEKTSRIHTGWAPEPVSKHPYVSENEACRPVISETLKFLKRLSKDDKDHVTPRIARPRIPQDILFAVGGYRDRRPSDVIEAYDVRADRHCPTVIPRHGSWWFDADGVIGAPLVMDNDGI